MIIDSNSEMVHYTDNPPAYAESVAQGSSDDAQSPNRQQHTGQPKAPAPADRPSSPIVALHVSAVPVMPQPRVYHYQNPATGECLSTFLPPDHPEMLCLQQGGHVPQTKFGCLGVLAAIVWFPLGIGLCMLDRRVQCQRCGVVMDGGICG